MRRPMAWTAFIVAAGLAAIAAHAARDGTEALRIDHPFARATPPGAKTAGVYLTVDNVGSTVDQLVHASTPVAAGVVLHQMVLEGGVMKMRAVPSVEIIPGARMELGPDGYHLMLLELKQPLRVGERFPLTLTFQHGGTILISVLVEGMGATEGGSQ